MSRNLILFTLAMLLLLALVYAWANDPPFTAPALVAHEITRGPQSPSDIQYEKFMEGVRALSPEPTTAAWILQQGSAAINFNTEIPVWSIIVGLITGLIAFISLREQMKNHIKTDDDNFESIKKDLREIRQEIRHSYGNHEGDQQD